MASSYAGAGVLHTYLAKLAEQRGSEYHTHSLEAVDEPISTG